MKQNLGRCLGIALLAAGTAFGQAAKHPFTAHDWATLRSARAAAVSPDGTILYHLTFGGEKGPTLNEWWTIAADGSRAAKLDVSDDFSPMGTFQGAEYFQILAARGKTVRLVTYPGSPHFPMLWEQRLNVMQELTDWLARYNKNER
jgi:pimeloyl-ACP methyl ester carboxylesterase